MDRDIILRKHKENIEGHYKEFESPILRGGWERCIKRAFNEKGRLLNHVTASEFAEIKAETRTMYAYCNRVISALLPYAKDSEAYVLVNSDGVVLKLYCSDEIREWLGQKDITEGAILSEESAGVTAFSIGISILDPYQTSGEEHYLEMFADTTMYFSPCILEDNSDEAFGQMNLLGGVGIIKPKTEPDDNYLPALISICKEVCLHIDMVDMFYRFYLTDTTGYICVDIDRRTEKYYTLYHNANIFNVLGIPYQNLVFQSAYNIFDPLPANQQFWDIVNNRRHIRNKSISITVNGRTGQYFVSTEIYRQSKIGYEGMRFFISNEEKISTFVSRQIGNNALLSFNDIIGQSRNIKEAIKIAERYAEFDNNILILGESGCGKDIFAQAIHNASARKEGPFIAVNCATFPKDLMVSELFGYEAGAFTGSKKGGNTGKMELANHGTLFLDEIGTLPMDLQAILLRAIETKRFRRLGGSKEICVDVRIIAATNEDIINLVEQKGFREDLYYRLSAFALTLPPLRERTGDVELLSNHFIERVSNRIHLAPPRISKDALTYLNTFEWRGNVRELQNFIEGIVQIFSPAVITLEHVERYLTVTGKRRIKQEIGKGPAGGLEPAEETEDAEAGSEEAERRQRILDLIEKHRGNKTKIAMELGVSRKTLYQWFRKYGIKI